MRVELEPIPTDEFDADMIWQLAGFALNNCRIHIEFEDGDADGEPHAVKVTRYREKWEVGV